ncbi:Ribonuclease H domain [Sesbania bispinosa]|nr:Ribonuclease H domain [Sesbania bispinosa]
MRLGCGNSSIWYDDWTGMGKFCNLLPFIHIADTELRVNDLWVNGDWCLASLATPLTEQITNFICNLEVPMYATDAWSWQGSAEGIYSSQSAYGWLQDQLPRSLVNILCMQNEFSQYFLEGDSLDSNSSLWWKAPPMGYAKLNIDGSFIFDSREMGYGGVLRDSEGTWQWGFSGLAEQGSVIEAELVALMKGLHFAWENSFRKLICETDSLEVVHLITNYSEEVQSPFHDTLRSLMMWLDRDWDVCVKHVFREANLVADRLAKLRNRGVIGVSFWTIPPLEVIHDLAVDHNV